MNPAGGPHSEAVRNMAPIKRFGTDDEVAGLVPYLASQEAALVTGASLNIDGGYLALAQIKKVGRPRSITTAAPGYC
jgi:3-oxoacyl-[acyl-carrier protein] reductase